MILKTEAIVLSIHPYSRTSHVVTWLTRDYGCITTAVKGACRAKSAFLGQYDLFYTCEMLFYRRSHNGVHAIRECTPLQFREPLRSNWRGVAAAGYITNLTAQITTTHSDLVYKDLQHALEILCTCEERSIKPLIFWYEIRLLGHFGIAPELALCPKCHPAHGEWLRFSIPAGRLLCAHNNETHRGAPTVTLHREVVKLLRRFAKCDNFIAQQYSPILDPKNKNERKSNLVLGLSRFLGIFITFHLDLHASIRSTVFEILNSKPA